MTFSPVESLLLEEMLQEICEFTLFKRHHHGFGEKNPKQWHAQYICGIRHTPHPP